MCILILVFRPYRTVVVPLGEGALFARNHFPPTSSVVGFSLLGQGCDRTISKRFGSWNVTENCGQRPNVRRRTSTLHGIEAPARRPPAARLRPSRPPRPRPICSDLPEFIQSRPPSRALRASSRPASPARPRTSDPGERDQFVEAAVRPQGSNRCTTLDRAASAAGSWSSGMTPNTFRRRAPVRGLRPCEIGVPDLRLARDEFGGMAGAG